jgi:transketolase
MHILEPDKWKNGPARVVAEHAIESLREGKLTHESWIDFPGGWPRFLDMLDEAKRMAAIEQGESVIESISLTMSNEILKNEGVGQ